VGRNPSGLPCLNFLPRFLSLNGCENMKGKTQMCEVEPCLECTGCGGCDCILAEDESNYWRGVF